MQWTTGKTGSAPCAASSAIPALELVGCYAYSPDKVGQDVGTLAGIAPIGVTATDDVEALLALQPDCVTYIRLTGPTSITSSGSSNRAINVVTTMYMLAGGGYGADVHRAAGTALQQGRSSLYASGHLPGPRADGRPRRERDVSPDRPAVDPGIARHERLRERADVSAR